MGYSFIEEAIEHVTRSPKTRATIDFLPLYEELLSDSSKVNWRKIAETNFVVDLIYKKEKFVGVIYGPKNPQLDITKCFSDEEHFSFKGEKVDNLYEKISSRLI